MKFSSSFTMIVTLTQLIIPVLSLRVVNDGEEHLLPSKFPKKATYEWLKQEVYYNQSVLSEEETIRKLRNSSVIFQIPYGPKGRKGFYPYVRANIERIGALFREFAVIIAAPPASAGESLALEWKASAKNGSCDSHLCHPENKYDVFITGDEAKFGKYDCDKKRDKETGKSMRWNPKTCHIARARDAMVDFVLKQNKFDYSIAVDSDMGKQWSSKSFLKAFSLNGDWSMIAANGVNSDKGEYQDAFAWTSTGRQPYEMIFQKLDPNKVSPIKVQTAFGGVAIYQTKAFMDGCIHSTLCGTGACEHVCFQKCLSEKKHKLYVHPGFVVEWPVHKIKGVLATADQRVEEVKATWECEYEVCDPPTFGSNGRVDCHFCKKDAS